MGCRDYYFDGRVEILVIRQIGRFDNFSLDRMLETGEIIFGIEYNDINI